MPDLTPRDWNIVAYALAFYGTALDRDTKPYDGPLETAEEVWRLRERIQTAAPAEVSS